jgi:CheY-like chemotaxis protein
MPRVTGLELLRWVREREDFRDLPICMVTSSDQPKDREAAMSHGVEAYCVKPVSFSSLVRIAGLIREEAEEHCDIPGKGASSGQKGCRQ